MARTWDQDYDRDYNRDHNRDYNRENKFTRFFDDFLSDAKSHVGSRLRSAGDGRDGRRQPNWVPAIDVTENEREYTIVVDVPGVRKEDIDIEFNDSVLVLSGHHRRDPTIGAAQDVNVKHDLDYHKRDQDYRQPPDASNYQPQQPDASNHQSDKYPQSDQYQQQPPPPQQQQQSTEYPQPPPKQQGTEYQSSQQPPTDHQQSNQQPSDLHRLKKSHHKDNKDGRDYEKVHIQERRYGYFSRSIQLPSNIRSSEDFPAKLDNGVLKISVPKNNERPRRKITIM